MVCPEWGTHRNKRFRFSMACWRCTGTIFVAMLVPNKMCNEALSHADWMAVEDCLLGMHWLIPVLWLLWSACTKTGHCPHQQVRFYNVIAEVQLMLYPTDAEPKFHLQVSIGWEAFWRFRLKRLAQRPSTHKYGNPMEIAGDLGKFIPLSDIFQLLLPAMALQTDAILQKASLQRHWSSTPTINQFLLPKTFWTSTTCCK